MRTVTGQPKHVARELGPVRPRPPVAVADGDALGLPVELLRLTTSDGRALGPLGLVGG